MFKQNRRDKKIYIKKYCEAHTLHVPDDFMYRLTTTDYAFFVLVNQTFSC